MFTWFYANSCLLYENINNIQKSFSYDGMYITRSMIIFVLILKDTAACIRFERCQRGRQSKDRQRGLWCTMEVNFLYVCTYICILYEFLFVSIYIHIHIHVCSYKLIHLRSLSTLHRDACDDARTLDSQALTHMMNKERLAQIEEKKARKQRWRVHI